MTVEGASSETPRRSNRTRLVWLAAGVVALLVATVVAVGLGTRGGGSDGGGAGGDDSARATSRASGPGPAESEAAPTPTPTPTPTPVAKARRNGMTVAVPAVGVRAKVLPLKPQGGVLDPPTLNDAYLIDDYGLPGSQNTVYIAGHSWDTGKAVFNPLFDIRAQRTEVEPGDEVVISAPEATYTYVVERSERYPRPTLDRQREVWEIVPGRLVLITCFQPDDGGEAEDNLIVYATLRDAVV